MNPNPYYNGKSARHRKHIRRWQFSCLCRPQRESESWASRMARWNAELLEGFEA